MRRLLFTSEHTPTLKSVRDARHEMDSVLHSTVPHEGLRASMQLLLSESLTNLVAHAKPLPGSLKIKFGKDTDQWWMEICDDGAAWNPLNAETPEPDADFTLTENGRGISLLKSQSDHISYHSDQDGNRLRIGWNIPLAHRQPCVMIVDDDPTQSRLLEAYLQDHYQVKIANDGREALRMMKNQKIDIVVSDIMMPGMTGLTLRENLDRSRDGHLIPFIFLTGSDDEELISKAASMGVDDFLTKPISKKNLTQVIDRVLERSQQVKARLSERLDQDITSALTFNVPRSLPDWEVAAMNKHTGIGGGDFLLHHTLDDKMLMVLADTMGHDDSAKFFAHAYAGYLRGFLYACASPCGPSLLLRRLSGAAWQDQLFSRVTMTCAALALLPNAEIELASAGHPPALLIADDGVSDIDVTGMLPGLLMDVEYDAVKLRLREGERLAIYTDGLFESAPSAHERENLEQAIRNELHATRKLPLAESLSRIEAVFDEYTQKTPRDDVSLVLIEPRATLLA